MSSTVGAQILRGLLTYRRTKPLHRCWFANTNAEICWKCGANKSDNLFCNKCNTLQEPSKDSTYFDIIGIEKNYDLSICELAKRFKQMQNEELNLSENHSALVNEAYTTLMNPLERGLYLLKLEGHFIEEGTVELEPDFLMEIMELNEQLAEAETSDAVLTMAEQNQKRMFKRASKSPFYENQVSAAFKVSDVLEAKRILVKMKYFWSLEEKIKEMKQKMGIVL
ncbi:hypothetical protein B566_EDAN011398 [Ephemera danica]|nr:hypothetical protein B566_EDAN011398 [Ephemera danica]